MQAALEEVARHCASELTLTSSAWTQTEHWTAVCAERKSMLTACAAKCSGLVNSVKERCHSYIEQYERCLKANAGSPETCQPQLERVWACSEGADPAKAGNHHICGPNCKH